MSKPITAIVIPADSAVAVYATTTNALADFQRLTGGYIEAVTGPVWTAYLNEEGKMDGLPTNDRADYFMHWASPCGLAADDNIVGDVVLVGHVDDDGDDTSVPQVVAGHFGVSLSA